MTPLAPHMEAFFREHLVRHRGVSPHTCDSYAYSFQSLFEFASQKLRVAPSALMLEQLDASLISSFLEHLETARGNSAETRNIRLAAIRSFFRFLQHHEPATVGQVRRVLAIPFKKTDHRLVPYLAQEEMQALLDAPDPSTRMGVRDRAILHLAVCAGLRVSELTGLRTDDVAPQSASIRVRGKGRRERALPLWKTNKSRPTCFGYLRNDRAASNKDIRKVSLWLGHSDLTSTEVYVRADPSEKLEAIEAVVPPSLRKGKFRPPDKLLALLKVKP
jgi:integrase/recombinase XerD